MKILYLASRDPQASFGGREFMIQQSLSCLSEIGEVHAACFSRTPTGGRVAANIVWHDDIPLPGFARLVANVFSMRSSLNERYFWSPAGHARVLELVREVRPDVIVADMLRCGQFVADIDQPKILDLDDLLSSRYAQMRVARTSRSIFGSFSGQTPYVLRLVSRVLGGAVLRWEEKLIRRSEVASVRKFSAVVLTSEEEAAELSRRVKAGNSSRVVGIGPKAAEPLAQRVSRHAAFEGNVITRPLRLGFIGNLRNAHNATALEFLLDEALPALSAAELPVRFVVAGGADSSTAERLRASPQVDYLGEIESTRQFYEQIDAVVAPILVGTGVNVKTIEAVSCGCPLIGTKLSVRGTALVPGLHFLEFSNGAELVEVVASIVAEPRILMRLRRDAAKYAASHLSKERAVTQWRGVIDSILRPKDVDQVPDRRKRG